VSLATFILLELHQRLPMLDLSLFRSSTFAGANMVVLLVALAMFGVFFFVSLYMQNILGYSAVQAGAAFLPLTLLVVLLAPVAGRISDRLGSRSLMTFGMTHVGLQLLYFSTLGVNESYWALVPGMLLGGIDMPAVMTPASAAAMSGVSADIGGRRLGGPELLSAGRRLAQDRADGRDHGARDRGLDGGRAVRPRLVTGGSSSGAPRRSGDRVRRRHRGGDDSSVAYEPQPCSGCGATRQPPSTAQARCG
jgi:hypothetical protein